MTSATGITRFERAMVDFSGDYLKFGRAAQKRGEDPARPTDEAFYSIFQGFIEIRDALEYLQLIETLMGLPGPTTKRVRKEHYVRFLVSSYLQEVYILEQRLTAYAKVIGRLYRASGKLAGLLGSIGGAFGNIVRTRSSHVHMRRYSDQQLDMLDQTALMAQFKDDFHEDLRFEVSFVRAAWRKRVRDNNKNAITFIHGYCDSLFDVMANANAIALPDHAGKKRARHGHSPQVANGA